MDYQQADRELHHGRSCRLMVRKNLCNKTRLERVVNQDGGLDLIDLVLFEKHILTWKPSGHIALDNKGYWTVTTKDRYNRFLPHSFRIWKDGDYWFIRTPTGTRVFHNGMELTADGYDTGLSAELNRINAPELVSVVHEYAKQYVSRLVRGQLREPSKTNLFRTEDDCLHCRLHAATSPEEQQNGHLLQHVQEKTYPSSLILSAIRDVPNYHPPRVWLHRSIENGWAERQLLWRKPPTLRKLIEQTELKMTGAYEVCPERPHDYSPDLRKLMKNFLLEQFGFEKAE